MPNMFKVGDMWYNTDYYVIFDCKLYCKASTGLKLVKEITL